MVLSILPVVATEDLDITAAAQAMVETEMKFSQTSAERGIKESFLKFFADDSVIFAPEPKNAKQFYTAYEEKGRKLTWQPVFATIAGSGELGITTGPWEMKKSAADTTPIAFGQFFTVWKKQRDNSWKVIVDLGIDNPRPSSPMEEIEIIPPRQMKFDPAEQQRALDIAEKRFAEALKTDAGAAVLEFANEEIRVLRQDSFPATSKAAAKLMLNADHGQEVREKLGTGISAAHDLAWRYGTYSAGRGVVNERGYYVSVWVARPNGQWNILVDLQKKISPAEK